VINSYFAPFNHKPTSTNVAVLELGEPEQLIEIQVVAVDRLSDEMWSGGACRVQCSVTRRVPTTGLPQEEQPLSGASALPFFEAHLSSR